MWNYANLRIKFVRLYLTRSCSDAQNDAAMLGQASSRGISANDVRMPEHRPQMQFEGG